MTSMLRDIFDNEQDYLAFVEKQLQVQRGSDECRAMHMRRVASLQKKLMNLHKLILQKHSPNDEAAGRIRTTEVEVSGEPMLHSDHVPDALEKFINWFNAEEKTTKNVF
ncbi:hypothetical protein niasHT_023940 [Heterodera trifolii]|uniref:Uncharacterized protein n=1 Tax=Heterodera trifolii TaxID=157864 RepID=A0ABD2JVF1_9BILA